MKDVQIIMRIFPLAWLAAATGILGGCTAMDKAGMDETFHNTPQGHEALRAQMERDQQARETYTVTDRYLELCNEGYSKKEAVTQAYKDMNAGVPPVR